MENTKLFKKIYGALIGSAIGDAMGGPVEGFTYQKIEKDYGLVDKLLPYTEIEKAVHGPFDLKAGAYTDDSRMSKIFANAMIKKGSVANSRDIAKAYIEYYFNAKNEMEKGFMQEYYDKAVYMDKKEIFGGQPTNGAIMGITPYGVINACNPQKSHDDAFEAMFMTVGYARYAASMASSAISSAMKQDANYETIIEDMMESVKKHKSTIEGDRWSKCHMYPYVGRKTEKLVEDCIEVAKKYNDVYEIRKELYDVVVQEFFADGAESLAIALAFFYMAKGDFKKSIIGCVNFGRDNDSSASIAGAISGALNGVDDIPKDWIELIESVNEGPTFKEIAKEIYKIVINEYSKNKCVVEGIEKLL